MQMLSAIEGIDMPRINKLLLDDGGSTRSEYIQDFKFDEEGEMDSIRVRRRPPHYSSIPEDPTDVADAIPLKKKPTSTEKGEEITIADFRVLKRIPPAA